MGAGGDGGRKTERGTEDLPNRRKTGYNLPKYPARHTSSYQLRFSAISSRDHYSRSNHSMSIRRCSYVNLLLCRGTYMQSLRTTTILLDKLPGLHGCRNRIGASSEAHTYLEHPGHAHAHCTYYHDPQLSDTGSYHEAWSSGLHATQRKPKSPIVVPDQRRLPLLVSA